MHTRHLLILLGFWMSVLGGAYGQTNDVSDLTADDPSPASMVESCLDEADKGDRARLSCIGISVAGCRAEALTTADMIGCLTPEFKVWETRVSSALATLRAVYVEQDAYEDPIRALAPRLDIYQSEWIAWRDAKCGFEYDKFRGGSMGRITSADCHLDETARRALDLEELIEEAGL